MRTSRTSFLCALAAPISVLPAVLAAQTIPSPYAYLEEAQEIGVIGGAMDVGTGRFGYGPDGGQILGVRYGIELSGPLALEGVTQWISGQRNVVDPGREENDRVIGQADQEELTIEARLRFSFTGRRAWHRLSPFLAFGGGIAIDMSSPSDLDAVLLPEDRFDFGNSFYGTVSGGTRWFVTRRFTLRGDGTFSLWKIDTPPGYTFPERGFSRVPDGEWLGGWAFSLALLYRW